MAKWNVPDNCHILDKEWEQDTMITQEEIDAFEEMQDQESQLCPVCGMAYPGKYCFKDCPMKETRSNHMEK